MHARWTDSARGKGSFEATLREKGSISDAIVRPGWPSGAIYGGPHAASDCGGLGIHSPIAGAALSVHCSKTQGNWRYYIWHTHLTEACDMRQQICRNGKWNRKMQRVDAGYLYELGDTVKCIGRFKLKDVPAYEIFAPLVTCRSKLTDFLENSVYSGSLRGIHQAAHIFCNAIDQLVHRMVNEQLQVVSSIAQADVQQAFDRFEPALQAELTNQVTYLVLPKGVYDVVALIEQGSQLFPQSIHMKAPEATDDIVQGAKSMAYELWTSAAFHFHRANESVLRRYHDHCAGPNKRPKVETMGTLLRSMEDKGVGDKQVLVALTNIKDFHRNPIIHPGQFVEDAEEAFSLVAAIRAAMGYMLDRLPLLSLDELMARDAIIPEIDVPPAIDLKPTA